MPSLEHILFLLGTYQYLFLFPLVVVEGPIATVLAGFLASVGQLNLLLTYGVIVVADVTGDSLYYAFGRYGGRKFIERWGRFVGIKMQAVERMEKHFKQHAGKTLVIGKVTHAVGAVVLVAGGIAKVPFWKFVWYNLLPTIPKSLLLLLLGFYFGQAYAKINTYLDNAAIGIVLLTIVFVVVYVVAQRVIYLYGKKKIGS